ncbi:MAG: hypothetical protein ACODAB_01675 [Gemmatimonadota bacterium]
MNASTCARGGGCGTAAGRVGATRLLPGALLVLALLFSGDIVRIHGHADGAPASADCVACTASLTAAVEADPPPTLDPPPVAGALADRPASAAAPSLVFVRQGGLRDPPFVLA